MQSSFFAKKNEDIKLCNNKWCATSLNYVIKLFPLGQSSQDFNNSALFRVGIHRVTQRTGVWPRDPWAVYLRKLVAAVSKLNRHLLRDPAGQRKPQAQLTHFCMASEAVFAAQRPSARLLGQLRPNARIYRSSWKLIQLRVAYPISHLTLGVFNNNNSF